MRAGSHVLALLLLPQVAQADPGEDYWRNEIKPALAKRLNDAKALIEAEQFGDALPVLKGLANDLPANADVFNLLGFAYRKTGSLDESGKAYERALFLKPDHLAALEYQGELRLLQNDIVGAEANFARLANLCPSPCEETDELALAIDQWRREELK